MALTAGSIEIKLFADLARLQSDMNKANKTVDEAMGKIDKSTNIAKRAFASLVGVVSIGQIVKLSDEYKRFDSQLKLSTKTVDQYNEAYARVVNIARTSQSDIGAIGVLYARLANNLRDFGTSQQSIGDISEAIALSLRISNATVQETNSVMLQLSQSFGSGKINGQEFLAVAEGAPMILRQLATSMGVSYGALKEMSAQGKLTAEELSKALSDPAYLAGLREQIKQVGTVSSSVTVFMNSLKQFIGESDKANGISTVFSKSIILLADSINLLATGAIVAAIGSMGKFIGVKYAYIQATSAEAAAIRVKTAADIAAANAQLLYRNAQLAAITSTGTSTITLANNAMASTLAANASRNVAIAQAGVATATGVATTAMTAFRAALAFLGGPIGAIVTALGLGATAFIAFGNKSEPILERIRAKAKELNQELAKTPQALKVAADSELKQLQKKTKAIKAQLEVDKKSLDNIEQLKKLGFGGDFLQELTLKTSIKQAQIDLNAALEVEKDLIKEKAEAESKSTQVINKALEAEKFLRDEKIKILSEEIAYQNKIIQSAKDSSLSLSDKNEIIKKAQKAIADLTGATKVLKAEETEAAKDRKEKLKDLQDEIDFEFELGELKNKQKIELDKENDEERRGRIEDAVEKQKEFNAEVEKVKDAVDPTRAYTREVQKLGEMFNLNRISADEFTKAAISSQKNMLSQVEKDSDFMKSIADSAAKNMQTSFANFLFDPFENGLSGMLSSFANTLRRMAADQLALSIFKQINSSFGGSDGIGAIVSSIFGGARADGGDVQSNKAYLVGERGPEIFMPKNAGTIVPNHEISTPQPQQTPPAVNIKNINVLDPSLVGNYLSTDDGERLIMNTIQRNRAAFGL